MDSFIDRTKRLLSGWYGCASTNEKLASLFGCEGDDWKVKMFVTEVRIVPLKRLLL